MVHIEAESRNEATLNTQHTATSIPSPLEIIMTTPNLTSADIRTRLAEHVRSLPEEQRAAALTDIHARLTAKNQPQSEQNNSTASAEKRITPNTTQVMQSASLNENTASLSSKVLHATTQTIHSPVHDHQELRERQAAYQVRLDQVRTEDHMLREAIGHKIQHWGSMIGIAPISVLHSILEVGAVGISEASEKVAFGISRTITRAQQGWERGKHQQ